MFETKKTLIVVYKDELLMNQLKKLVESHDDDNESVVGTKDDSINIVSWTEKVWLGNKKAGNISSKILFLGNIKGVEALIPVVDVKFEEHGVSYGWAGNQAVIYAKPEEIKSIENYYAFHTELESLPAPQFIKDSIKPKIIPTKEATDIEDTQTAQPQSEEDRKKFRRGREILKKAGNAAGDVIANLGARAFAFSEENFKNKKTMERQMLFFGVIKLYNEGLESFMND